MVAAGSTEQMKSMVKRRSFDVGRGLPEEARLYLGNGFPLCAPDPQK
jgi:hypothetical protein